MNIPAFPAPAGVSHITEQGMTLRDYFAAKAMQAMLASPNCPMDIRESALAASAYSTADAMMRARERM
jgi:hypothetical protein